LSSSIEDRRAVLPTMDIVDGTVAGYRRVKGRERKVVVGDGFDLVAEDLDFDQF